MQVLCMLLLYLGERFIMVSRSVLCRQVPQFWSDRCPDSWCSRLHIHNVDNMRGKVSGKSVVGEFGDKGTFYCHTSVEGPQALHLQSSPTQPFLCSLQQYYWVVCGSNSAIFESFLFSCDFVFKTLSSTYCIIPLHIGFSKILLGGVVCCRNANGLMKRECMLCYLLCQSDELRIKDSFVSISDNKVKSRN